MTTEAKVLSECGTKYVIDDKDRYQVEIEAGEYLVIEFGAFAGKAAARFTHPNIAATAKRIYEFKHYRDSGSKFWTSSAGVSHYFVVPRSAVTLLPEKGYSYVKAIINGVKVSFNVSGGTGNGWTDWLRTNTQVAVGHKLADLKKIAAVAVRGTPLEPLKVTDPGVSEDDWNRLAAKANTSLKNSLLKMIEEGKKIVVKLAKGYSYDEKNEGVARDVSRGYKRVKIDETHFSLEPIGRAKAVTILIDNWPVRAKMHQIDWYATAEANGKVA